MRMTLACLTYLQVRARRQSPTYRRNSSTFECLRKMLRPVALPFGGRLRNAHELMQVLRGGGNIREQQCSIWLFFANILAEDAVGSSRLDNVYDLADEAGLSAEELRQWVSASQEFKAQKLQRETQIEDIDPRFEFLRMDWHPIRQLQIATRRLYSERHQQQRFWSTKTREQFVLEGGTFSAIETTLQSPRGPRFLPWMDTKRFFGLNSESGFIQRAQQLQIPMLTGVSGVGMHTFQFARVLNVQDRVGVRLAALAYLLPIEQHSYYEVLVSESSEVPPEPERFDYRDAAPVDWGDIEERLGELLE